MTVPNWMPPTPAGRAKNVATTHASLSGQGQTKAARPVTDNKRQAQVYRPPITKGGPVASATYRDLRTGLALGSIGDPSSLGASAGDAGSYFAYNGSDGIILLLPGWYQVSATAVVSGATPGDALRAFCFFTTPQTVEGSDIAGPGGTAYPVAMSLPFYDTGSGSVVQVSVENHTSANGTLGSPTIHLVAFG